MVEKVLDKEAERWTKKVPIFVPHHGLDYTPEINYFNGVKEVKNVLNVNVNGKAFKVQCDVQTEVIEAVADALAPILKRQRSNFLDNS